MNNFYMVNSLHNFQGTPFFNIRSHISDAYLNSPYLNLTSLPYFPYQSLDGKINSFFALYEKENSEFEQQNKDEERKNRIADLAEKLSNELLNINDERESYYSSERLFDDYCSKHPSLLGEVLQEIFLEKCGSINVMLGLCNLLSGCEYAAVTPWGSVLIIDLLHHKDDAVKEAAISVVENWGAPEMIKVLENTECSKVWMQDYVNDVIDRLKK